MNSSPTGKRVSGKAAKRWLSWAALVFVLAVSGQCYRLYFSRYYFLPKATRYTLPIEFGESGTVQLIEQLGKIYLHYSWKGAGSRAGRDEIVRGGQQCDGAVTVLKEMFMSAQVEQLDLATVDDDGITHGHSIAMITHRGHRVYADPSYGLVWLGGETRDLIADLTELRNLSRVGAPTPVFDHKLGRFPSVIYDNMRHGRFHCALPNEPLLLSYPVFTFKDRFLVGMKDGSNQDIEFRYGSYQSSLGCGKRLIHQVFSINGKSATCLVEFQMTKADTNPLFFDITGSGIAKNKTLLVPNEAESLFLFICRTGKLTDFTLEPHGRALGGRGIDAISIRTEWGRGELTGRTIESMVAKAHRTINEHAPIEIRREKSDPSLSLLFKLNYWSRCMVEFVPGDQSKNYCLVYTDGSGVWNLPMSASGLSRYAIVWEPKYAATTEGMVGITDVDGKWLTGDDIEVLRILPAESGASFFSLGGGR